LSGSVGEVLIIDSLFIVLSELISTFYARSLTFAFYAKSLALAFKAKASFIALLDTALSMLSLIS